MFFGLKSTYLKQIKIWDKQENGNWLKTSDFAAHDAPIWKVKWAHPDFGCLLASCSYDKSIMIWEETKSNTKNQLEVFLYKSDIKLGLKDQII